MHEICVLGGKVYSNCSFGSREKKTNPPLIERIWQRANFKCVYTIKYTVKRPSGLTGLERLYCNKIFINILYISAQ